MNFDTVKQIVNNRMCEPDDTEKQASNLAKRAVEAEENQKPQKKDTLSDMQKLANAKNMVSAMTAKAKQQSDKEQPKKAGRPKGSTKKAAKKGPGRPPKKETKKEEKK